MFEWPRFADHLGGVRPPEEGMRALLVDLAEPMPTPSAKEVLSAVFDDGNLVNALGNLAPRMHHVGFIAPRELGIAAIEAVLRESPFRVRLSKFKSVVLAKDLSSRLRREVDVTAVRGSVNGHPARCPAVEIFVADLPPEVIENLVAEEIGCHVALTLEADASLDRVRHVLRAHRCPEIPLMRNGPLTNHAIHASVLYVDVPGRERTRRLEFITST